MNTITKVYLNRKSAAAYLKDKYVFCGSWRTLAKLACEGDGPLYSLTANAALYRPDDLDIWAQARISKPAASTSAHRVTV